MGHLPVLPLLVAFALLAAGSVPRGADATCTFPLRGSAYTPCGNPLQGTHSKGRAPDNWQSDNAVDLCAPPGTKVYAVENGVICNRTCGFGFDPDWGYRLTLNAERDQFFYNHLGERKEREREVEGGSKRNPYVGCPGTGRVFFFRQRDLSLSLKKDTTHRPLLIKLSGYIDVKRGDIVKRGQFLGTIGDFRNGPISNSFPPHLHFGARSADTAKTYLSSCVKA